MDEVTVNTSSNIVIVLIGNKSDKVEERKVSKEEAEAFAQNNNIDYIETSAKEFINVDEAFEYIAKNIQQKIKDNIINPKNEFGIKVGGFQ